MYPYNGSDCGLTSIVILIAFIAFSLVTSFDGEQFSSSDIEEFGEFLMVLNDNFEYAEDVSVITSSAVTIDAPRAKRKEVARRKRIVQSQFVLAATITLPGKWFQVFKEFASLVEVQAVVYLHIQGNVDNRGKFFRPR